MTKVVFLDRDGVLNAPIVRDGRPHPPEQLDQFVLYPEAATALDALRGAGYRLIVVTNQPDVARGTQSRAVVEAMHAKLRDELPIEAIRVCYHDDADRCGCRKPEPGMLLEDPSVDLGGSFMIGDRWRDVEAGRRAGCTTIFVDRGYRETRPANPTVVVASLEEAARWILRGDADALASVHAAGDTPSHRVIENLDGGHGK